LRCFISIDDCISKLVRFKPPLKMRNGSGVRAEGGEGKEKREREEKKWGGNYIPNVLPRAGLNY
jgi:hypothetical protein